MFFRFHLRSLIISRFHTQNYSKTYKMTRFICVWQTGDRIRIIQRNPSGLWFGECRGRTGNFKFINVEELEPIRSSHTGISAEVDTGLSGLRVIWTRQKGQIRLQDKVAKMNFTRCWVVPIRDGFEEFRAPPMELS